MAASTIHHDNDETKLEQDDLITVCEYCLRASCWQGIFYCDNYMEAGTTQKTRSELIALNFENPSYLKTDAQLANEGE